MNSFNHYSLDSVGEWLYRCAAGIDVAPDGAGFRHFVLRPTPDMRLGFLLARFESPYGTIEIHWRFDGGAFVWEVAVPANTAALACVPAPGPEAVAFEGVGDVPAPVEFLRGDSDHVLYTVAPGRCRFRVKPLASAGQPPGRV